MRRFEDSTFVFISTNQIHHPGGVEERWIAVMQDLVQKGAQVRFLALMGSPMAQHARELGIEVDPYILDMWNVVRSRSRLRKYLKRYKPVAAHSTGVEADFLLRWASRTIPLIRIAHTLTELPQETRRRRPINALIRHFDELGMRTHTDAVFVPDEPLAEEANGAGISRERIVVDDTTLAQAQRRIDLHLRVYLRFMAERGIG